MLWGLGAFIVLFVLMRSCSSPAEEGHGRPLRQRSSGDLETRTPLVPRPRPRSPRTRPSWPGQGRGPPTRRRRPAAAGGRARPQRLARPTPASPSVEPRRRPRADAAKTAAAEHVAGRRRRRRQSGRRAGERVRAPPILQQSPARSSVVADGAEAPNEPLGRVGCRCRRGRRTTHVARRTSKFWPETSEIISAAPRLAARRSSCSGSSPARRSRRAWRPAPTRSKRARCRRGRSGRCAMAEAEQIRTAKGDIDAERDRLLAEADAQAAACCVDGRRPARRRRSPSSTPGLRPRSISPQRRASDELRAEIARLSSEPPTALVAGSLDDATQQRLIESFIARCGIGV